MAEFSGPINLLLASSSEVPGVTGAGPVVYYKMRGIDQTCPPSQQPAYVYWVAEGAPDTTASLLTPGDLPCGSNPATDVVDIRVASTWESE